MKQRTIVAKYENEQVTLRTLLPNGDFLYHNRILSLFEFAQFYGIGAFEILRDSGYVKVEMNSSFYTEDAN